MLKGVPQAWSLPACKRIAALRQRTGRKLVGTTAPTHVNSKRVRLLYTVGSSRKAIAGGVLEALIKMDLLGKLAVRARFEGHNAAPKQGPYSGPVFGTTLSMQTVGLHFGGYANLVQNVDPKMV